MYVEKKPCDVKNYCFGMKCFLSAREALKETLQAYCDTEDYTIILPGYIGWSPKEGSGIYDPINELGIRCEFYSFTQQLVIDIDKLKCLLKTIEGRKVILLVHYFGYVDPNYMKIISLLKNEGVFIIEDAAHALYTHLIDNRCGLGDCILYSFHKMLPFHNGGAVCTKYVEEQWWNNIKEKKEVYHYPFYKYDLKKIADKRKENAAYWEELLQENSRVEILREAVVYRNQTPQTFPVLLNNLDRYKVYREMNRSGYGIISLYHTMIKPIVELDDTIIKGIADRIINFPVHQDIGKTEIKRMYEEFERIIS